MQYIFEKKSARNSPAGSSSDRQLTLISQILNNKTRTNHRHIFSIPICVCANRLREIFQHLHIQPSLCSCDLSSASSSSFHEKPHSVTHGKLSNGLEGHTYWLPQTGSG